MKVVLFLIDNSMTDVHISQSIDMDVVPRLGECVDVEDFKAFFDSPLGYGVRNKDWVVKKVVHRMEYIKIALNPC